MKRARNRNCLQVSPRLADPEVFDAGYVVDLPFVRDFALMCEGGWRHGWHERNGGNASYRLTAADLEAVKEHLGQAARSVGFASSCVDEPARAEGEWIPLEVKAPELAGEHLLITAAGSFMQNLMRDPEKCLGIIELNDQGSAYRSIWGFEGGGRPTSEVSAHVLIHARKKTSTNDTFRVLYHCHPVPVIALSHALGGSADGARAITRLLWKMMTECVMVFPQGLGFVPCEVPGSMELAKMTADQACDHDAVVWAQHGLLAMGESFDATFGLIHVIVKAAQIYESACIMSGGPAAVAGISDEELARIAKGLGVSLNPAYC